jgi:FkbM family methyltransferase
MMKKFLKQSLNSALSIFGARLVGRDWGPRGFIPILRSIRDAGVQLEQIVDVGASDGSWTLECMEIFDKANYFLVDPLPINQAKLSQLANRNSHVAYFSGAVGSKLGRTKMFSHGDQSSLIPGVFESDANNQIEVELQTLDNLFETKQFARPDFIKLDVQGFELEVFKGAAECLRQAKVLLVETHIQPSYENAPFAHEIITELGRHGFRIFDLCSYVQRPIDSRLSQIDFVFAKPLPELFRMGWD